MSARVSFATFFIITMLDIASISTIVRVIAVLVEMKSVTQEICPVAFTRYIKLLLKMKYDKNFFIEYLNGKLLQKTIAHKNCEILEKNLMTQKGVKKRMTMSIS